MPVDYPKISIVTPSFNQARFLERTIRSILDQNYPNLEYVIIDGGSTDGSVEIIKKYEDKLHYWVSEEDNGQYDALNKGFAHTTGEIMAYMNSDDTYLPWAFHTIGEIFREFPSVKWISTTFPMAIDENDIAVNILHIYGFTKSGFFRGENLLMIDLPETGVIQQESTFWRRSIWEKTGAKFNQNLRYAGDFDLWVRFFQIEPLIGVEVPLACFRFHNAQKTSIGHNGLDGYMNEAKKIFFNTGGRKSNRLVQRLRISGHTCVLPQQRDYLIRFGLIDPAPVMVCHPVTNEWSRVNK